MDRQHQKPLSAVRRKLRGVEHLQCPAYQSPFAAPSDEDQVGGLTASIRTRSDMDYARQLIGAAASEGDPDFWRPDGWCEIPQVDLYVSSNTYRSFDWAKLYWRQSYEFVLSATGQNVDEDLHPTSEKIETTSDGYIIHNVTGIRTHIVSRLDGKGYDITQRE